MRAILALLALAACGDNSAGPIDAAPVPCSATFTGNFAETATSPPCAQLTATTLELQIPSLTLAPAVAATFTFSQPPSPGTYVPATVTSWDARGSRQSGNGVCLYAAGSSAVPTGTFSLDLTAIDRTVHGTATVQQTVLAFPGTTCGDDATELVTVAF